MTIHTGDCIEVMATLPEASVRFCGFCGLPDTEHDPMDCERDYDRRQQERVEQHGPCPYHDYGLPFDCTCLTQP